MREILFRGIDFLTGKWVQGDLLHISSGCIIYHGSQTESEIKENTGAAIELLINEISVVKPKTIGQFTGLTDKNGVKIFEADVVKANFPYAKIGVVEWDKKRGSLYVKPIDGFAAYDKGYKMNANKLEIIGNIHDNPELLNKPF